MYSITVTSSNDWNIYNPDSAYIVFVNALEKPPHIAFVWQNVYYSYGVAGIKKVHNASSVLSGYSKRHIPLVLFKLAFTIDYQLIERAFSGYTKLTLGNSCLNPIKDILTELGKIDNTPCYAYDVVLHLINNSSISEVLSFSCTIQMEGNELSLPFYDQADINRCVEVLKHTR
jgi:hypothetical protein